MPPGYSEEVAEHKKALKQMKIIQALGVKPVIDPGQEVETRTRFLMDYLTASHARGFVLGISGGQDSTLAGKLAQRAVDMLRAEGSAAEFIAVRLPHGVQADEADAQTALKFIQPDRCVTVNIAEATCAVNAAVSRGLEEGGVGGGGRGEDSAWNNAGEGLGDFNLGNVKARLRMLMQYAIAGERNLLVIGTDHAAENVTGFFTKFGDGAADVLPLAGLNKRQGAQLLEYLGAPASAWEKVPTADLEEKRPALPDEEALGVSYRHIDDYLEGKNVPDSVRDVIEKWWEKGQHKRHLPASPTDTWWW